MLSSQHVIRWTFWVATVLYAVTGPALAETAPEIARNSGIGGALRWQPSTDIPPLPDPRGLSGAFVGSYNEALIFAGGSNFDKPAWKGGQKQFHSTIHVLLAQINATDGEREFVWVDGGALPMPLAQGAAVPTRWGLICLGGTDGTQCSDKVFALEWLSTHRTIAIDENWPALPKACEKLAATAIVSETHTTIYVAGGITEDGNELSDVYSLSVPHSTSKLAKKQLEWRSLPTWPGKPRFGAAMVAQHDGASNKVYLLGGKSDARYLSDAYRYAPDKQEWSRIADLPRPALLAPATAVGPAHIFLFAGSDGHDVDRWQELKDDYHFVNEVLAYHTITDTWTKAGAMPTGIAATSAVAWHGGIVLPGGELRPSVRTCEVQFARLVKAGAEFGAVNYAMLCLYLVVLLGVGLYFSKREHSTDDFFLAGRRIPWWAAGLSLLATQVSSIGFLAIPAKSFATNWTYFAGVMTWFIVVPIVTRIYIPFFRSLNVTTAYEYLEARFNYAARLVAAVAFCLLQLGRMGVVLLLPALALAAVTGIDVITCILIMGIVATVYTVAGGMEAVIWTDVVQAVILLGGAIVCVFAVVMETSGGWSEVLRQASADDKLQLATWGYDPSQSVLWVILIGNVLTRLSGLTADQTVVQRYLTTKDASTASRALWLDVAVSIPWAIVVFAMGTALYVFYKHNPGALNPTIANDAIVPLFIAQQLPVGVAGLVIAAVFAAAMSSLDSSMHSVATVYLTDVHNRMWRHSSERRQLMVARGVTAVLGCFGTAMAAYMATTGVVSLWDTFLAMVGAVAGVLAGLFLLGMFTTRTHGVAAVLGVIVGAGTMYLVQGHTSLSLFLYPLVGIGTCFVTGYLLSFVIPGRPHIADLTVFTKAPVPTRASLSTNYTFGSS